MTGNTIHNDNVKSIYGTSSDGLEIFHDGGHSYITDTGTGSLFIQADASLNFKSNSQNENWITATSNGKVDLWYNGSRKFETTNTGVSVTGNVVPTGSVNIPTSQKVNLGNSNELFITHDGSSILRSSAGTFYIDNAAVTQSIVFRVSNANALDTTALTINREGDLTTGADVTIAGNLTVNGTTTTINTQTLAVEDPLIELSKDNGANSIDIGFYGKYNDGTARYLGLFSDASDSNKFRLFKGTTVQPTTTVNIAGAGYVAADLVVAGLEASNDVSIIKSSAVNLRVSDGTQSVYVGSSGQTRFGLGTGSSIIQSTGAAFGIGTQDGFGLRFGTNNTDALTFDTSQNASFTGDVSLLDSKKAKFGNSGDLYIQHTGSLAIIDNQTGDFIIKNSQDDGDIIFQSDNGSGAISTYFRVDGGVKKTIFEENVRVNDSKILSLGSSDDFQLYHNTADSWIENYTGNINIRNRQDDGDIVFYSDDGSGGHAQYFRVDGSEVEIGFLKTTHHYDNVQARFGDAGDLRIYHDGSNSYIQDTGTGNLLITSDGASVQINKGTTENMAEFITDGAVKLYYDSVKKFETTSTGAAVSDNSSGTTQATFGGLSLVNTDTTVNNGAAISFAHNTASSGSHAKIGAIYKDRTGSSEDTDLFFGTLGGGSYSERMRIKSTGQVGVGTDSPTAKFEIQSPQLSTQFDRDCFLRLHPTTSIDSGGFTNMFFGTSPLNNYGVAIGGSREGTDGTPSFSIRMLDDSITGTEVFNISSLGELTTYDKVTIANPSLTSTPLTQLLFDANQINDGGGYNIDFKTSSNDTANRFMSRIQTLRGSGATSSLGFFTETGSALNRALLLDSSQNATFAGNVGIGVGTITPTSSLTIQNNAGGTNTRLIQLFHNNVSANGYVTIGAQYTSTNRYVESEIRFGSETLNGACSYLGFVTGCRNDGANTEKMRITSDGKVGIGENAPGTLLSLKGAADTSIITLKCTKNDSSWNGERIGGINFFSEDGSGPGAGIRGSINYVAASSSGGSTAMTFKTGDNTERMRIDNSGNTTFTGDVIVPNGKISTIGGNNLTLSGSVADHAGISFATNSILPCVVSATNDNVVDLGQSGNGYKDLYLGGGVFLGGTGTANKLDDYEEGTFTPVLKFNGGTTGITYSTQAGVYTKIGRQVNFSIEIRLSNKGSSTGTCTIDDLPFTAGNITGNYGSCMISYATSFTVETGTHFTIDPNTTNIKLRFMNGRFSNNYGSGQFDNSTVLLLTGSYQSA